MALDHGTISNMYLLHLLSTPNNLKSMKEEFSVCLQLGPRVGQFAGPEK